MTISQRFNKFILTTHITFSVGWLGAVAVFLALAITGMTSSNTQMARAAYLAMELSAWLVIVPFCFASLLSGVAQSLITKWGLFKHYWIIVKLILTVAATIALLLHMNPIGKMAKVAAESTFSNNVLPGLQIQLIADAGAALLLLFGIVTLSIYKPWGKVTNEAKEENGVSTNKSSWRLYLLIGFIGLILFVILKHLIGGGMGGH
jgi:hypothetical protein